MILSIKPIRIYLSIDLNSTCKDRTTIKLQCNLH